MDSGSSMILWHFTHVSQHSHSDYEQIFMNPEILPSYWLILAWTEVRKVHCGGRHLEIDVTVRRFRQERLVSDSTAQGMKLLKRLKWLRVWQKSTIYRSLFTTLGRNWPTAKRSTAWLDVAIRLISYRILISGPSLSASMACPSTLSSIGAT